MPGEAHPHLVVALMAAGLSTRFGSANKLEADLGGRPLIEWSAAAGRTINAGHHLLVAPQGADFGTALAGYLYRANADPQRGMASSLKLAAQAAHDLQASALLVLLADMPFITGNHLTEILSVARSHGADATFTRSPEGIAQPPALFTANLFPALLGLEGDQGARALAQGALHVDADAGQLLDIDRPEDLEEAHRRLALKA